VRCGTIKQMSGPNGKIINFMEAAIKGLCCARRLLHRFHFTQSIQTFEDIWPISLAASLIKLQIRKEVFMKSLPSRLGLTLYSSTVLLLCCSLQQSLNAWRCWLVVQLAVCLLIPGRWLRVCFSWRCQLVELSDVRSRWNECECWVSGERSWQRNVSTTDTLWVGIAQSVYGLGGPGIEFPADPSDRAV
jgi:hypothetical protein